jgi:hypothetical protein
MTRWRLVGTIASSVAAAVVALLGVVPQAGATGIAAPLSGPSVLDPAVFGTGLSTVSAASGDVLVFNTDTGAITLNGTTIRPAGGGVIAGIGVVVNANSSGITGFYMGGMTVASDALVYYAGQLALGLLTTGDFTAAGTLAADALGSASGQGAGQGGMGGCSSGSAAGGGGAGHGGVGGMGGSAAFAASGQAGPAYGVADLSSAVFSGGSGGGAGRQPNSCQPSSGGAGGGGLAVISLGHVDLSGAVLSAVGGSAVQNSCYAGGGGGSGGSIMVVAPEYTDTGATLFRVVGGSGANAVDCGGSFAIPLGGGGAGGGGRVTVLSGTPRQGVLSGIPPLTGNGADGGGRGSTGAGPTVFDGAFLSVTGPATGDVGESVSFTAAPLVGEVAEYDWDFGDGSTATTTDATVSHVYADPGSYVVGVVATMAASGASTAASTSIDISDVAISGLTASNNGPTPVGLKTRLTASIVEGTNVTYAWDFGDGTIGAGAVVRHAYRTTGPHTATVTATNGEGSVEASTTVTSTDPTVSVMPASVVEGTGGPPATYASLSFVVGLSAPVDHDVTVDAQTADGTAIAPDDYRLTSTTVTIRAGHRTAKFKVRVIPDAVPEGDEQLTVSLSSPVGATIGTGTATGTIIDDDSTSGTANGGAAARWN